MSAIFHSHECEEKIGYVFSDKLLLRECFTHSSYAHEHGCESNEKLEYLGDSVLNFIIADYLFENRNGNEGDLTKRRAEIVSSQPLASAIRSMGAEGYLLLGNGEINKPVNDGMCENLFEAIVAGIYKDGGLACAKKFITDKLLHSAEAKGKPQNVDYKTKLKEYVEKTKQGTITYVLIEKKGPDHSPEFTCGVKLEGKLIATGVGKKKTDAEKKAAEEALKKYKRGK